MSLLRYVILLKSGYPTLDWCHAVVCFVVDNMDNNWKLKAQAVVKLETAEPSIQSDAGMFRFLTEPFIVTLV